MKIEDFYNQTYYRIHDPKKLEGCFEVTGVPEEGLHTTSDPDVLRFIEGHRYNADNWGIYWTVNEFNGARQKKNLTRLRAWFVECDGNNKAEVLKKLKSKLMPSMIIESKAGYHAYWFCDASASVERYSEIIEFRLIPYYRADPNAKDIARILRVPDYFHCKKPDDKFLIRLIHYEEDLEYSEQTMLSAYSAPYAEEKEILKKVFKSEGDNLWERVYNLDCEEALKRLSGTSAVNGEYFTFKRTSGGKLNIVVNGETTSCWVDRNKRIGSRKKGGPTIFNWINYYMNDTRRTTKLIKQFFPELFL